MADTVATARILSRCRYGIQACGAEGFGISVAEMVKAGAIVFAPANGGQTEILDTPDLLFTNQGDAIAKIEAVLREPERRKRLAKHLASRALLFDEKQFMRQSRALILRALAAQSYPKVKIGSAGI